MKTKHLCAAALIALLAAACQESIGQRLEREARQRTERQCPQRMTPDGTVVLDSIVFHDNGTNDFTYFYTLQIDSTGIALAKLSEPQLREELLEGVKSSVDLRHIKDAGLNIVYTYRTPQGQEISTFRFTKADYQ